MATQLANYKLTVIFLSLVAGYCLGKIRLDEEASALQPVARAKSSSNSSDGDDLELRFENNPTHQDDASLVSRYDSDKVLGAIAGRRALAKLPALTSSENPQTPEQLEAADNYFYKHDSLSGKYSIADVGLMALIAKSHSSVYNDIYVHKFDKFDEIKLASGPLVNQETCLSQLGDMVNRTEMQLKQKYRSKDINLFQILDTFGHSSAGLLIGNAFFEGMYHECVRLKLELQDGKGAPLRYCVAKFEHVDWPKIDKHNILGIKAGVCLPKSCNSLSYKNKYELILKLIDFNLREMEKNEVKLVDIYCLPDEDSPLRSLKRSPATLITLACLSGWISLLLYATYKYHKETNGGGEAEGDSAKQVGGKPENVRLGIFKMLSITNNLQLLFSTEKESSLIRAGETLRAASKEVASEREEEVGAAKQAAAEQEALETTNREPIVDLRCIEGVKVIAMAYVIMGHVLMCVTSILQNGREMSTSLSISFLVANLVPAFAVNSFFTITGVLTCYLMSKQNQAHSFIHSPAKWFAFIIYRYLRIMPMYALVVLYTKTLAKYTGSGPLWDYATTSLGQRGACEIESWLWTLSFTSNFVPPLQHCIPSAWYLANDFQFFMVTPIFLALLNKRPKLGEQTLKACALLGYLGGVASILFSSIDDVRPIAKFAPHGFKTYISHFSFNYTRPQYRIPAYLIGLLIGHKLYMFEATKLKYLEDKRQRAAERRANASAQQVTSTDEPLEEEAAAEEPDWPASLKQRAIPLAVLGVFACCVTPLIGSQLYFSKLGAKIMVSLITPSYHIIFASAVGVFLLLATTGHGNKTLNRFLSAAAWKPFARLSLCAVLINVEVINYIIQSNSNLHYLTNSYQISLNMLCIVATYVVATIVCVLFEAPIRAALNCLLTFSLTKVAAKQKAS